MTTMADSIDSFFPMTTYRSGQRETIKRVIEMFEEGTKIVLLEGPTGSGKSAIGFTIAQLYDSAYYLCPQKFLQDQLTADFGESGKHVSALAPMIDLKGRNAYPCNFYDRALVDPEMKLSDKERSEYSMKSVTNIGCDAGECKNRGESNLPYCVNSQNKTAHCPYFQQLYKVIKSPIALLNFHSFLFQSAMVKQLHKRKLLIIDEGHQTEDVLLKFVEVNISDRPFLKEHIKFPQFETVIEYQKYFIEIGLSSRIENLKRIARSMNNIKEEDEWSNLEVKLNILKESDPEEWIAEWRESKDKVSRAVSLKPLYIDKFANKYLFSMADHVLIMSATILSKSTMCDALGMDKDLTKMIRIPSTFPADIRPFKYVPSGSMSWNDKKDTLPKLIRDVNDICKKHAEQRGIIHTHTFEIAEALLQGCNTLVKNRFLFQRDMQFNGDKTLLLNEHTCRDDSIIIAPAMHEGLDLYDDLGRFQIICKVPYPSKSDPQICARMELSSEYYDWRCATKLVQSYGRIYRHDKDHGITYMLDENFKQFYDRAKKLLPKWFIEAIIWS